MLLLSIYADRSLLPWYEQYAALKTCGAKSAGRHCARVLASNAEYTQWAKDSFHMKQLPMNEYWAGISGIKFKYDGHVLWIASITINIAIHRRVRHSHWHRYHHCRHRHRSRRHWHRLGS